MVKNISDEQAVIAAEQALADAHLTLDLDVIDRLLHPDYLIVQPDGSTETKADVLASYRTGNREWQTAEVDELAVSLYGDATVVHGRRQAAGRNGAETFDYAARFLSAWIMDEGRWQNVAYQSIKIDKEEKK